jgi:hypothetical protein
VKHTHPINTFGDRVVEDTIENGEKIELK